jgi:hypothetical protein
LAIGFSLLDGSRWGRVLLGSRSFLSHLVILVSPLGYPGYSKTTHIGCMGFSTMSVACCRRTVEKLPKSNGESKRNFDSAHVTFPFVLGANYIAIMVPALTPEERKARFKASTVKYLQSEKGKAAAQRKVKNQNRRRRERRAAALEGTFTSLQY